MAAWRSAEMARWVSLAYLSRMSAFVRFRSPVPRGCTTLGGAGAPVVEGQAHLGGELLVDRELVVGSFVMRQCLVDQGSDVVPSQH
jgi:hypothetical protein